MRSFCLWSGFGFLARAVGGLLLGVLLVPSSRAQEYLVDQYSLEEGLPQSQVTDVAQGPRGYLWIGLFGGGVARFDGQQFEMLTVEDGLPSNAVTALHASASGALWIGTSEGVARYDGTGVQAFTTKNGAFPHGRVNAIVEGPEDALWIGTTEGVVGYDGSSFRVLAGERLKRTYSLGARDDTLWIGTNDGLYRYTDSTLTAVPLPDEEADEAVIATGQNGRLWVDTDTGLFEYHDGQYTRLPGTADLGVIAIREDSGGTLWVGTQNGLYRRDERGLRRFPGTLGTVRVRSIFADRERNVWFCTNSRGLFKYTKTPFDRFTTVDGLPNDVVWSVDEGPDGDLWIATGSGLSRYDGTSFSDVRGPEGRLQQTVFSLHRTQAGPLWIGGQSLLFRYDGSTYRAYDTVARNRLVSDIAETPSGDVWFATIADGVLRYDGSGFTHYTTEDGLASNQVRSLTVGPQGRVWAGKGASRFDGERFRPTPAVEASGISQMGSFEVDADGALWMGSQQGLYLRPVPETTDADSLVHFTFEDGFRGTNVVLLLFDRKGHLWAGTEEGLNRLDVETYKKTGEMPIRSYTRENGLFAGMAAEHAGFAGEDGTLWFGTSKGLVRYNPSEERALIGPPRPHVTDVALFSETADWEKYADGLTPWERLPVNPVLPPDKDHLIFHYTGLHYTAPDQVRYRYRLKGFSERWSKPTQQRQATYSNLPPGTYTFQVKASKGEGTWSSRTATYTFTLERPFWQATWFYVICGLGGVGLLGLGVGLVWRHVRRLRKENRKLRSWHKRQEERRTERASE